MSEPDADERNETDASFDRDDESSCAASGGCRFEISPPRHFIYPALLLLLAEEPRYGYRLVDALLRLGLGPVGRPSVYRALGELEADGLLESWTAEPTAGSMRHMYGLTSDGRQRLDEWMGTIVAERDALTRVVKRFDAICEDE